MGEGKMIYFKGDLHLSHEKIIKHTIEQDHLGDHKMGME